MSPPEKGRASLSVLSSHVDLDSPIRRRSLLGLLSLGNTDSHRYMLCYRITHPLVLGSGMHTPGIPHPGITSPSGKQEMDHYDRSMKSQPEPKREKEAKKPTIKKPLNAFMLYMKEMRAKVIAECTLKESAAINQILGRRWHALSREEQAKYYELARKERQLHMQLYPGWSARDNYVSTWVRSQTQGNSSRIHFCLPNYLTLNFPALLKNIFTALPHSLLQALHPVITQSLTQGPWNSAVLRGRFLRQGEKRKEEQERSSKTPIQGGHYLRYKL
ncbi:hypothetical protein JD844_012138 [Phrynosoma platyrhinos]|uniref:HMG box domain-containing protein n=1 Tax=Phrynosoma platyrhinos TaxID=52577 RepID=A0ABQ7TJ34_PHRPL|nr:hypothetical protein JD844_012138 [Phrynosoma platyrhinos]